MESASQDTLVAIANKDAWTAEDHRELLRQLVSTSDAARKFQSLLGQLESAESQPKGTAALKLGIARYMACRFQEALDVLAQATDNKDRRYFQAMSWKNLRRYDKAVEELEKAKSAGWDANEIDVEMAEALALGGKGEAAQQLLSKLESRVGQSADVAYLKGLLLDLQGLHEKAAGAYEQARVADPYHTPATFRLAYFNDLHGDEDQAIALYKQCVSRPPINANALLNLAVLYEDAGRYDQAMICLRRVLASNPANARARMFLKDIEDSKTMYFDEDRAKRVARRNAVMDIPVTDFELSVRARNCLKKMNIRTLGDLVRTSEAELLAYKNFGETSLKEIKDMLTAKGLRLGQPLDEETPPAKPDAEPDAPSANEGLLATPISQIDLSIRARKAIEALDIDTLGDLASKTEPELLACRNFGQTSLNEIRQRLAEYGLKLREPS